LVYAQGSPGVGSNGGAGTGGTTDNFKGTGGGSGVGGTTTNIGSPGTGGNSVGKGGAP